MVREGGEEPGEEAEEDGAAGRAGEGDHHAEHQHQVHHHPQVEGVCVGGEHTKPGKPRPGTAAPRPVTPAGGAAGGPGASRGLLGGLLVAAFSRGTRRALGEACLPVLLCIPAALRCGVSPLLYAQSWFYI